MLFIFWFLVTSFHHCWNFVEAQSEKSESICSPHPLVTSQRFCSALCHRDRQEARFTWKTSFCTVVQRKIPTQLPQDHGAEDVQDSQDFMALLSVLEVSQGGEGELPDLRATLDSRHGHVLCPSTTPPAEHTCPFGAAGAQPWVAVEVMAINTTSSPEAGSKTEVYFEKGSWPERQTYRSSTCVPITLPERGTSRDTLDWFTIPYACQFFTNSTLYTFEDTCPELRCQGGPRDQCRDDRRNAQLLPRHFASPAKDSCPHREARQEARPKLGDGFQPARREIEESSPSGGRNQNCSGTAPPGMADTPEGKCHTVEGYADKLYLPKRSLPQPYGKCQTGARECQHCHWSPQRPSQVRWQKCAQRCRSHCGHTCAREGRAGGGSARDGPEDPPTVHRPHGRGRSHYVGRWRRPTSSKALPIRRCSSSGRLIMMLGSAFSCLPLNDMRWPRTNFNRVLFKDVEAYGQSERNPLDFCPSSRAACIPLDPFDPFALGHSIQLERDCQFPASGLFNAWKLRSEILLDSWEEKLQKVSQKWIPLIWNCSPWFRPAPYDTSWKPHCVDPLSDFLAVSIHNVGSPHCVGNPRGALDQGLQGNTWQIDSDTVDGDVELPPFEQSLLMIMHTLLQQDQALDGKVGFITWYVDHHRVPQQQVSRTAWLEHNPLTWRPAIVDLWRDWFRIDRQAQFYVVTPQPNLDDPSQLKHIIIVQDPLPGLATLLLQIVVKEMDYTLEILRAETVNHVANYDMLYQVAQLGLHCTAPSQSILCTISCGQVEFPTNRPILVQDATTITIRVYNEINEENTPFDAFHDDALNLFQQKAAGELNKENINPNVKQNVAVRDVSPSSSIPLTTCRTFDAGNEEPWEVSIDNPLGHINNLPVHPLHTQAQWIQDLAAAWEEHCAYFELSNAELQIRSWFLDPTRYLRWQHWRPIQLTRSTDYWWGALQTVWCDIIDDTVAVDVFLVHPQPDRPFAERNYHFDIIIAQNLAADDRPTLVVTRLLSMNIRFQTAAELLLPLVSKWELIYHIGADQFCSGISWSHDFHRLCLMWRDLEEIGSAHTAVHNGDCFTVDIHPPRQIAPFEDDEVYLMGRNPVVVRPRVEDDIVPAEHAEDPHDHLPNHALPGRWYNIIVFTYTNEGTVGRISSGDLNHFYNQVASLLGINTRDLLELHEVGAPPHDLEPSFDYIWVAQGVRDIPVGSHARLVLTDVEFCENFPVLDSETVRKVRMIVTPATKKTVLSALGLLPYCQQSPCLFKVNSQFVSDTGPIQLCHGDYLQVIVGPTQHCQEVDTRTAALASFHGLGRDEWPRLSRQLPDGFHLHQVPNSERYIDSQPFPEGTFVDLLQRSLTLSALSEFAKDNIGTAVCSQPISCHNDGEMQETLQNLRTLRNQVQPHADDRTMDQLADLLPVIRDLHGHWLRLATPWAEGTFWAPVETWYISHAVRRICAIPRTVWLGADVNQWYDTIMAAWSDYIDVTDSTTILIVSPPPVDEVGQPGIHLILVQRDVLPEEGAGLVSLFDDGFRNGAPDRQAMVLPLRVTNEVLLTVANRMTLCLQFPRIAACSTKFGHFDLTHEPMRGRPGLSYEVRIQRWQPNVPPMAVGFQTPFPMVVNEQASDFVQSLHRAILLRREREPEEPINLRVMSWFLNHEDSTTCLYGREVDLPPVPTMWPTILLQHWPDQYKIGFAVEAFVVHPMPQDSQWREGQQFHIILHQQALLTHISTLVTVFDNSFGLRDPYGVHKAAVLPRHLQRRDVLQKVELLEWCEDQPTTRHCTAAFQDFIIDDNVGFVGAHGHSLRVTIHQDRGQVWQAQEPEEENDDHLLLQKDLRVGKPTRISIADSLPMGNYPQYSFCEGSQLWHTLSCIDEINLPLRFDFHWIDHWDELKGWCQRWWDFQTPFTQVQIYYDGSYFPEAGDSGVGIAAFVLTNQGWVFAGAVASKCPAGASSYEAELWAGITATKFAMDILRFGAVCGNQHVELHFCFDAITIGHQADGSWASISRPKLGSFLRGITHLISMRFEVEIYQWHVRGHRGEVGNEFVDELAKQGALGTVDADLTPWFNCVNSQSCATHLPWIWTLFDKQFLDRWKETRLEVPRYPCSMMDSNFFTQFTSLEEQPGSNLEVTMKCVSHNALTLAGSIVYDYGSPSRVEHLIRVMKQEQVHLFGIQETRLRTATKLTDSRFLLYKSQASSQGHFGMMIGLSLDEPFAHVEGKPLFFKDEWVSIVVSDPRRLILRIMAPGLHCLVANLHAPHSGQTDSEIAEWWETCSSSIPSQFRDWPCILLTDANALVGHDISHLIGPLDGSDGGSKADAFIEFVHRHQILLPATFEHYHSGPSPTWTHSSGQQRRIDYVGLPAQWTLDECAAWTLPHFGSALLHDDHIPVIVKFTKHTTDKLPGHRKHIKLRAADLEHINLDSLAFIQQPPWDVDVHTHFDFLQSALYSECKRQSKTKPRKPVKTTLTEDTWLLIQEKRQWRADLAQYQSQQNTALLRLIFSAWHHQQEEVLLIPQFDILMTQQDRLIAWALFQFRRIGRLVCNAIRRDDKCFYENLLKEGADFLAPQQVKDLWRVVRRSLPQHKARRHQHQPLQDVRLESKWIPYLCDLELGEPIVPEKLISDCTSRQHHSLSPSTWSFEDVPTLQELEATFRRAQSGRATGFDVIPSDIFHLFATQLAAFFYPLVAKMFIWGHEPIQLKGGGLAMIHKKGSRDEVSHYRSIMLLPTLEFLVARYTLENSK